jgi:hypothetical protein
MASATRLFEKFDAATHTYYSDGVAVPSVTGCLEGAGLSDFSGIPRDVIERKQILGKYVHAAAEYIDQDDIVWESIDPTCLPYVQAYESFKKDTGFKPLLTEKRGVAVINGAKVGFTLDRFGAWCGLPFIVDLKCGAEEGISWRVQLAGYELCLPYCELEGNLPPLMSCGRAAVMLRPDGRYKVFRYDHNRGSHRSLAEARMDFDWFRACLFNESMKRRVK